MSEAVPVSVEVLLKVDDYIAAQAMHTRWTAKRALLSFAAIVAGAGVAAFVHGWS